MNTWVIDGGQPLRGEIRVSGAKNSITKLLVASILSEQPSHFSNVPNIGDRDITQEMCAAVGATFSNTNGHSLRVSTPTISSNIISQELGGRNRLAIMLMGPLLHRTGKAVIPAAAGGDQIGPRPVDFHLQGIQRMGARVEIKDGNYIIQAADGLRGAEITLDYPSVTSTENLLMAASMARGRTIIQNAAIEPEVVDLVSYLQKMGAIIDYQVDRTFVVEGVETLNGASHRLLPDRIVAASLGAAAVATGGDVFVRNASQPDMLTFLNTLRRVGGKFEVQDDGIRFYADGPLKAIHLETSVHPGFMTDWQSPFLLLLTQAEGMSVVHETVFEDRFGYVAALQDMGAEIGLYDSCLGHRCRFASSSYKHSAVIKGPSKLRSAEVTVPDLRAGFTYLIAAIMAEGQSRVHGIDHITRGYENLEESLRSLGARIQPVQ
ncbi:MAG: UDP-N-acetylglucosamine 1-carboxyvinyltransferase [Anaerolineales bacterium]|nr:UDP-N-acetylglucosamine 1-carboxyvinyltransferase [Anaerolineales bacterium]